MSLLPERPLLVSPQLAATLGLEEALLYQLLTDIQALGGDQGRIDCRQLEQILPFWQAGDIRRVSQSLEGKGVITVHSQPFGIDRHFEFTLAGAANHASPARQVSEPARPLPAHPPQAPTRLMAQDWRPAPDIVAQLGQYGIPPGFVEEQIPEFVTYWTERREPKHSWNAKFLKQVLRLWREEEARNAQRGRRCVIAADWRPSPDAVDILVNQAGINRNFIEDAVPEFVLYWRERAEVRSTWNSDFVRHVKRQWSRYTATIEHDSEPHPLPRDWQPNADLFEVLSLANIPREFAERELPAFTLFWREDGRASSSWNTKFLQHVKRQWAYLASQGESDHERRQRSGENLSTRHRSLVDDLTDRSWAG